MITEEIPIMTHHLTSPHHLINNLLHHQPSQQQSPHKQLPPTNTNHQSYNHQQQTATQQQTHLYQKPSQQQQVSHNNQSSYANNHPFRVLKEKSLAWNLPIDSLDFASHLDEEDHLRKFRELFSFPKKSGIPNGKENSWNDCNVNGKTQASIHGLSILNGQLKGDNNKKFPSGQEKDEEEDCLYLCGQSLGLKPKSVDSYVQDVLDSWARTGVNCHFNGHLPAAFADIPPKEPMSRLVGAKSCEVAIMNSLSVNLHVLLCTFYQPTEGRNKIIIEEHAFSSDMYVVKSQITLHGYSPDSSLVLLKPRPGESLIREEDAISLIEDVGESVAVILLPGIQYYTGQLFNIPKLTSVAQAKGIIIGVDLAHAVGNVPLHLHEWEVDFAAWCTYKYLNSGAGCIGGIFVHERWTSKVTHESNDMVTTFPMLKGWWGNQPSTKFLMRDEFEPAAGADMFKLSNPPPVLCAMLMASLDIFSQTTMEDICRKQFLLTGYLEYLLRTNFRQKSGSSSIGGKPIGPLVITFSPTNNCSNGDLDTCNNLKNTTDLLEIDILTPSDATQRGSQLSISFPVPLTAVQEELKMRGVVCDIRKPSVLRVAPAPLYNSFADVYKFVQALKSVCLDLRLHK